MKKIYLAHPFDAKNEIYNWQKSLKLKNIKWFNPFYPRRPFEIWDNNDMSSNEYYLKLQYKKIVSEDLKEMLDCDIVLAIINGAKSYGTIQEIVYGFIFHKPVYIICNIGHHNHPWLLYHSKKIFKTFKEAERWLKSL